MIRRRRRFRSGLRLGMLIGLGATAARALQSRRAPAAPVTPGAWQPLPTKDGPGPVAASDPSPGERPVDEVGEPIMEPAGPGSGDGEGTAPGTPSERDILAPDVEPTPDEPE